MPVFGGGKIDEERRAKLLEERRKAWKKAHKREWEPVEMKDAWKDLSRTAFAFHLRFHTFTAQQLKGGRAMWSRILGMSENAMRRWLNELNEKGYIRLIPKANGKRTGMVILKRVRVRFDGTNNWFSRI